MGQIGSAMSDIGSNAFSDLSGGEKALKFGLGAAKGLGQGLANRPQPPQGGMQMPTPMPQQPQVNLPQGGIGQPEIGQSNGQPSSTNTRLRTRSINPFFGQ